MDSALVVTVATWVWLAAGVGVLGVIIYAVIKKGVSQEPLLDAIFGVAAVVAIGAMVLALRALGFHDFGLWTWRLAGIPLLVVLIFLNDDRVLQPFWKATPISVMASVLVTAAGFLVYELGPAKTAAPARPITRTTWIIDGVQLWHGTALVILGLGTLLFLWLFVRMVERGVTPQLDSHWGGIGGGMGGWRISASLTYLVIAAAFGVLFGIFVMQLEKKPDSTLRTPVSGAAQKAAK